MTPRLVAYRDRGRFLRNHEWRETLEFGVFIGEREDHRHVGPFLGNTEWRKQFDAWAADNLEGWWEIIDTYRVVFEKDGDTMLAYLAHL